MLIEQCRSVYSQSNHVAIDLSRIHLLAEKLTAEDLTLPTWTDPWCIDADPEKTLSWIFIFNAINFSYWSEPPWAAQVKGTVYGEKDPAFGVMAALAAALEYGTPLDDANWLKQIDHDDLKSLLYPADGFGPLPMMDERIASLQELGEIFAHFGGAIGLLQSCNMSSVKLSHFLNTKTQYWQDSVVYKEQTLHFAKRAWLVSGMIYGRFLDDPTRCISDPEQIPCFLDYRLPQFLSSLGILRYQNDLKSKIINQDILTYGSDMEIEIRVATQVAAYELREALLPYFPRINYLQIDAFLWRNAVLRSDIIPPHHRMRGMAY